MTVEEIVDTFCATDDTIMLVICSIHAKNGSPWPTMFTQEHRIYINVMSDYMTTDVQIYKNGAIKAKSKLYPASICILSLIPIPIIVDLFDLRIHYFQVLCRGPRSDLTDNFIHANANT